MPVQADGGNGRRAGAQKRVKHGVPFVGEELDEPSREPNGEGCGMVTVRALCRHVNDVGRVDQFAAYPLGHILTKAAPNPGFVAHPVCFAQMLQPRLGPLADRHHHAFLVHFEVTLQGEMEAPLPRVAEAIGPFARIAVSLAPNVFFCPEPALLLQGKDQL